MESPRTGEKVCAKLYMDLTIFINSRFLQYNFHNSFFGSPVLGGKRWRSAPWRQRRSPKHEGHHGHKGEERGSFVGHFSFETFVSVVVENDFPL
jgi:hypothetical protein